MTTTIDTTTDAYADYVAVVVNNMRPTDRATERGIAPATVSANVRRIRDAIGAGATVDGDASNVDVRPAFDTFVRDTYGDDVADAVDVFGAALNDAHRAVTRADDAIATATARRDAAVSRIDTIASMFDRATPKDTPTLGAMNDAYADAYPPVVTPDADADADA